MASFAVSRDDVPLYIVSLCSETAITSGLPDLLASLLSAYRIIGTTLRDGGYSSDVVGTQNAFGDHQLDVDIKTDEVMIRALKVSGLVSVASSEENPIEIACNGSGFSVAFDPLDGSSIVDANFAVGTITAIFSGKGFLNRTGRDQVAAAVAQYGPRVTIALALAGRSTASGQPVCLELTMLPDKWYVSRSQFILASKAKTFAPGNLRATFDNPKYNALVKYWIEKKYTLRYSGGLVPDVYHMLIKGEGVFSNASSAAAKAKLRLLYEAIPIALIVEAAAGASCVSPTEVSEPTDPVSVLDVVISDLDKRVGVCFGSVEEVDRFKAHIFS